MVRTPQCFRTEYSQFDGPRTLAAAEAIPCALARPVSLVKADHGVYPPQFLSPTQMEFSFVWISLPVDERAPTYLPRSAVSPFSTALLAPFCDRWKDLESCCSRQRVNRDSGHTPKGGKPAAAVTAS
jgi:hypothetical protein